MTISTPFQQTARDCLTRLSRGTGRLSPQEMEQLIQDPGVGTEDLAILSTLQRSPQVKERGLTSNQLEALPEGTERRYNDALERLKTPSRAFEGTGPDPKQIRQGSEPHCVLTSTAISLAEKRPEAILAMLEDTPQGTILRLPGEKERRVAAPSPLDLIRHSCAYQNGAWMTLLSRDLGAVGRLVPAQAIKKLTGNKADGDILHLTTQTTTRQKMERAAERGAVVIAGRSGIDQEVSGLTRNHSYAVIAYDPNFARIRMQDPEGNEPVDAQGQARDGDYDGRFSVSVDEFHKWFSSVHYERKDEPSFWGGMFGKVKNALKVPSGGGGGHVPA